MNDVSGFDRGGRELTLVSAIRRYWWLVLISAVACSLIAIGYSSSLKPNYVATAGLIVEDPRASSLFDVTDLGRPSTQASERYLADQVEILRSAEAATVASELLDGLFTPRYVLRHSSISGDLTSNLIEISFDAAKPEAAKAGADAMAEAYQELRRQQVQATAAVALAKVDALLASIDADLENIDREIEAAGRDNPRLAELERQFVEAQTDLNQLRSDRSRFPVDSAQRAAINAQINELLTDFATWEAVLRIAERGSELDNLLAEKDAAIQEKATLVARANSIEVDAELAVGGVTLVSDAPLPEKPSGPSLATILAGALALGIALSVAVAYFLGLRRWGVAGRDSPRVVLGAPLLAEVPNFELEGIESATPVLTRPNSASAEAFRFAASVIDIRAAAARARSLMIVSATHGAGRTAVVANTGIAAAAEGLQVMLIDADFAKQDLTHLLAGTAPQGGLTDVVDGDMSIDDAAAHIRVGSSQEVSLLSRGRKRVEAANYLRSNRSKDFFDLVTERFDLVLVDGPPILQVAYGSVLARYTDAAVVVVEHGTEIQAIEELRDHLALIELPILGYVYTKAPGLAALPVSEDREVRPIQSRGADTSTAVGASSGATTRSPIGDKAVAMPAGNPWLTSTGDDDADAST